MACSLLIVYLSFKFWEIKFLKKGGIKGKVNRKVTEIHLRTKKGQIEKEVRKL